MRLQGVNLDYKINLGSINCRKGLIYFPDFCQLVLERFRESESEEEDFFQTMFKVSGLRCSGRMT